MGTSLANKNYHRIILAAIVLAAVSDFLFALIYTRTGSGLVKPLVYGVDLFLLSLGFYLTLVLKSGFRVVEKPLILLGAMLLVYSVVAVYDEASLMGSVRSIRNLLLPFSVILLGYAAAQLELPERQLVRLFVYLAALFASYGIFEIYFLDSSFFFQYLNIANYYADIKGVEAICPPMHCGTLESKPEFAFLGVDRRISGVFLEPLTSGAYFASALALLLYYSYFHQRTVNHSLVLAIVLVIALGLLLSQSRAALIFVFIALVPVAFARYSKKLGLSIFYATAIAFFIATGLHEYFEKSVQTLGGIGGHKEDLEEFFRVLFDPEYFFGKGIGFIPIQHSGYAQLYTQFGYVGLVLCVLFIFGLMSKLTSRVQLTDPLQLFALGTVMATAAVFSFSSYAFSFKGYMIVWFMLGYSFRKTEVLSFWRSSRSANA